LKIKNVKYIEKGQKVGVWWYSEDSTYAKIKTYGRWSKNCYMPTFTLHDTLPRGVEEFIPEE